jgi:hypothetical protein
MPIDPTITGASHLRHSLLKAQLLLGEGGRRFRPRDQIGSRGLRRACHLLLRRAGLRNARDVGLAIFVSQAHEIGHVLVPRGSLPGVRGADIEVGLNQNRRGAGGLLRRLHRQAKQGAQRHHREQYG